ncbi:hypothetical protein GQ457_16G010240 [Hibiscus cannabinus]
MDIENDYFLVSFKSRSDFLHDVAGGPWTTFGSYLTVEPWTEDFSTTQPYPWKEIEECIGSVTRIDYQTDSGRRGRFARMAITIDLHEPLVSKLIINGRLQLVEYESLPMICFSCGIYGHNPEICPAQKVSTDDLMTVEPVQSVQPSCQETDSYGPWMVVERRQRRTPVKQENLSEHTTSTDVPPRSHASVVAAKGKGVAPHTIRTKKAKSALMLVALRSHALFFRHLLFELVLCDMGFSCSNFTWQRGSAHARLDRFICNTYWDEAFPKSSISHLLRMRSDHRPVLLQVGHLPSGSPKPSFRYFTGWQLHDDFRRMILDNWHPTGSLSETIRSFTVAAKLRDGSWCDDEGALKEEVVRYYKSLFSMDVAYHGPLPNFNLFSTIDSTVLSILESVPSSEEIHEALRDMAPLKAPGLDGLHAEFFQKYWDIVGPSACGTIREVFSGGSLDPDLNRTVLVLIPKTIVPTSFSEFRPISLCSVIYKLLTKIITKHLKPIMPLLINQTKTSFVSGRSITDNIIINQEAIHSMRFLKAKAGWLANKVDLEKAFDRVC